MSRPVKQSFNCPGCQRPREFVTWSSLNITLDPDKKQELLDGKLTRFTCADCGHSAQVAYSLLYHDMQRAFMVWLIPRQPDGTPGNLPDDLPSGIFKKFGDRYRFRVVDNQNQLIEKILIFDGDLDDRVIELAKLIATTKLPPEHRSDQTEMFFSGISADGGKDMMDFTILSPAGKTGLSVTRDAMYNLLVSEFAAPLKAQPPGPWPRVDAAFASQLMSRPPSPSSAKSPVSPSPSSAAPARPTAKKKWWRFGN